MTSRFSRLRRVALASSVLAVAATLTAHAQFNPLEPPRPPQRQTPQAPPPAPPSSPIVARVEGRPITQQDYDRIAGPYFERLRLQFGSEFSEDIRNYAKLSVLDELFRRELLTIEAQRRKIVPSEKETDLLLRQDPFFYTNGKFDPNKFTQYKLSPASNYLQVLPKLRELAAASRLDSLLRASFTPAAATLRAEWSKRNDLVKFEFLSLATREIVLEPEATRSEIEAYYAVHRDEFERKPRARLRYVRLAIPPLGDSLRAATEADSRRRARSIADSLRRGVALDSIALGGLEVHDTGLLEVPPVVIPGFGRQPELAAAIARADSELNIKAVGPLDVAGAVLVGAITERAPRSIPPLGEVLVDAKRRADADQRRIAADAERLAWYQAHPQRFSLPRVNLARVVLREQNVSVRARSAKDVEARWAAELSDSAKALKPRLGDAERKVIRERLLDEARRAHASELMTKLQADWSAGRDPQALARPAGAAYETLTFIHHAAQDGVFPQDVLDSLVAAGVATGPSAVAGPRSFGGRSVVWRVLRADTSAVMPYETARAEVDQAVQEEKRAQDEAAGRAWFEAHRGDYRTKEKVEIDYVAVHIPPPDSVDVPEGELRKHYDSNLARYEQEEQVRARHILISTNPAQTPGGESAARARIDSLAAAIRGGADFLQLAQQFSQDPSNAPNGGDLGFFARGRMVKEFADTSFALPIGRVSQPVKTTFGYHLIRVDEKKPGGLRPFDEVKAEIHAQLGQSLADSTARRRANAIRRQIVAGGDPAKLAVAVGGVVHSPAFAMNEPVPVLGFSPELAQEMNGLKGGRWAPKAYRVGSAYAIVRPAKRILPGPAEFPDIRTQAIEDAKNVKRREILNERMAAIRQQLAAGAALDSIAPMYGGLKQSGPQSKSGAFLPYIGNEPRVIQKAFAMKHGEVSDTVRTANGVVWIRVDEKTSQPGASFAKDREQLMNEMVLQKYNEWVEDRKKTVKIEILRADLRGPKVIPTKTVTISGGQ